MADDKTYDNHDLEVMPLMVQVTAPTTLPAGYTFEALVNDDPDRPFTCEVPEGGVTEGETFLAPLPPNVISPRIMAPTGRWKDGLCSCFSLGFMHPHIWCALCCSKIAMAQVMTRMQLTWLGEPGARAATNNTFKVVCILLVSYIVYSTSLEVASMEYEQAEIPKFIVGMKFIGSFAFGIWSLYSLCRTRQSVRARYSIPEEQCAGCEDVVCSFFCTCCVVAQMSRHTGEYETYPGVCCTTTGHPPGTPLSL